MSSSGTPSRFLLLLALAAAPALLHAQTLDTGVFSMTVKGDGFIGSSGTVDVGVGGFVFEGDDPSTESALYEGQLLVGLSPGQVSGEAYAGSQGQGGPEWVNLAGPIALTPPFPSPYDVFDQGYASSYDDSGANNSPPIGVEVTQLSYASTADPNNDFILYSFEVANTNGADLTGVYIGMFADWDVTGQDFSDDLGGYDAGARLLFVYDSDGSPRSDYVGVAALGDAAVSGWELSAGAGVNPTQDVIFAAMTNGGGVPPPAPDDRRSVLGTGPYTIPAGGSVTVRFAFVTGTDEADIVANAQQAQSVVAVAAEPPAEAAGLRLGSAYPNPFRGRTTLSFALDAPQAVRLAVYDALGRRVATLVDGSLSAGAHTAVWDAAGLASGVYVVRLEAAGASLVRRVLVAN